MKKLLFTLAIITFTLSAAQKTNKKACCADKDKKECSTKEKKACSAKEKKACKKSCCASKK